MTIIAYQCPLCQQPLIKRAQQYRCEHNHSFDIAKQGYVNLHLVQHKKSRAPGDNKAMVQSRREFLNRGYFERLPLALIKQCQQLPLLSHNSQPSILDVGCGEGYYNRRLKEGLPGQLWGVDISKTAIASAAKQDPALHYAVANNYQLPFFDDSFDVVLNIYAPASEQECHRVLKAAGLFIVVTPGPEHLYELKKIIYDQPQKHEAQMPVLDGFHAIANERVTQSIHISNNQDIQHLLKMTPYYWHLNPDRQKTVLTLANLHTTADFLIRTYQATA